MELNDYQENARKTAVYPDVGKNLWYPTLGLAGESGEVAENVKKFYRDDGGVMTDERKAKIVKELGDALWYIANVACELNVSLMEVAVTNLYKLQDRSNRDKIHGSGDNR